MDDSLIDDLGRDLASAAKKYPWTDNTPLSVRERISAYRDILKKYKDLVRNSMAHENTGLELCNLLSGIMDCFIVHMSALLGIGTGKGLAIAALGGYGRSELNPFSDIDILFLVEHEGSRWDEIIIEAVRFLCDMNLDLGHSTRTIEDCIKSSQEDTDLATSLLEARFISGDKILYGDFHHKYCENFIKDTGRNLAMLKIEERNRRLAQYGGTVQIRIPNVKESPGGLRDVHIIKWLDSLSVKTVKNDIPLKSGLITEKEYSLLAEDFDFLLKVRTVLHFLSDKKTDILELASLPGLAKNLGYKGQGRQPVEKFMRDYYMRAERIFRISDTAVNRFLDLLENGKSGTITADPSGFIVIEGRVNYPAFAINELEKYPGLIIKIFAFAGEGGLELTGISSMLTEKALSILGNNFPLHTDVRSEFHSLLNSSANFGKIFRLMHNHGVLVKLIPEFAAISWHYQYDFYHAFTTDEHSIRVVENLDKIAKGEIQGIRELTEIMNDITAKGALMIAGLLHDIGKSGGTGHSVRGEKLAVKALERLNSDERTIDTVKFLIREHLIMSHISQRRDMDDPEIIADFSRIAVDTMRLKMLTLLTFADLFSLSEDAMTEWKKALLLRLYGKASEYIEKGFEERTSRSAEKITKKISGMPPYYFTENQIRKHLEQLPEHYIFVTSPRDIKNHLHGIDIMKKQDVRTSFRRQNGFTILTVIARDYSKALSDICGIMTSSDINIVGAQIFTRTDGIIIDTFTVVNEDGTSAISPEKQKEFKKNLAAVIAGSADVPTLIKNHINRWKRRRKKVIFSKPRIQIHNEISSKFTVIDVFAMDYTGLLYDITDVMASFDLDIYTARIGTDEDQVADAFYLRHKNGGKIEDQGELKKITSAIIERLNRAY